MSVFRQTCKQLPALSLRTALPFTSKLLKGPWPKSASELHRARDRSLSAKLVPALADRGMSRSQHD
jgi:hypothetical protein